MNQGVVKYSHNYGQCFIPNVQPVYIVQQPNQLGMNSVYNQCQNYFPLGQPCIIPPMSNFYMGQQIMSHVIQENQIKTLCQAQQSQIREHKSHSDRSQNSASEHASYTKSTPLSHCSSSDNERLEKERVSSVINKNKIISECFQNQNPKASFQDNQFSQLKRQENASYQGRVSASNQENEDIQSHINFCKGEGFTRESVSTQKKSIESKINKKSASSIKCLTRRIQAGYRIVKQQQRRNDIVVIQTLSSPTIGQMRQVLSSEQEELIKENENTFPSSDSTFDQLNGKQRKASYFNQGTIGHHTTKSALKNLDKQKAKQLSQSHVTNESTGLKQMEHYSQPYCKTVEISNTLKERAAENKNNTSHAEKRVCIYNQMEILRKEVKRERIGNEELGKLIIQQMNKLSLFKKVAGDCNKSGESEIFQKEIACVQQQQKLIKEEFNLSDIETNFHSLSSQINYTNLPKAGATPTQYSDFIIQLRGNLESSKEIQNNDLLLMLQNRALTLQSNQQTKEASQPIQKQREWSSPLPSQKPENTSHQLLQRGQPATNLLAGSDSIVQSIILCEQLMESTHTHQNIFNTINQSKYLSVDDQFSNLLNFQNLPCEKQQILANFPRLSEISKNDNAVQKNQFLSSSCDQTNGSSTASASSSEKNILTQPTEIQLTQLYNSDIPLLQFSVKDPLQFEKFDFSQVRQITQKYRSARQQKQNTTYKANSKYHNMNKLLMYNIMSMFQTENLLNFTLSDSVRQHLSHVVKTLKILSKRSSEKYKFEYFSREHYHILFLKITSSNLEFLANSEKDRYLHEKCYNIDFSKEINQIDLNYVNIMKRLFFQIFMISIQHDKIIDDGSSSKQNLRRQYCQKAISGIKKLSLGEVLVRF